jgi:hypothetical protein
MIVKIDMQNSLDKLEQVEQA